MRVNLAPSVFPHVRDFERAGRWYTDVLGLRFEVNGCDFRTAEGGGARSALFEHPDCTPASHAVCLFFTRDVEGVRNALVAAGARVSAITACHDFDVWDPDGNCLTICYPSDPANLQGL